MSLLTRAEYRERHPFDEWLERGRESGSGIVMEVACETCLGDEHHCANCAEAYREWCKRHPLPSDNRPCTKLSVAEDIAQDANR